MDNIAGTAPTFTPTEFVAITNQSFEYAFPSVSIIGELSGFRVSRNKWLYFDIKDDQSKVKCFGTVFQLKSAFEDGMKVEITATPKLHNLYGFSLNVRSIRPVGEGSIKKAADLLRAKLDKEGLFAPERKRQIPKLTESVGLVTSDQSAACADFIKILNARWQGVSVEVHDVLVQGESAPASVEQGIQYFNQLASPPEVIVVIRGGGSLDDLAAFSSEQVTRAVAASRVPTVVAIGHEVDESLAELAADLKASTPSNAAELLFPDKHEMAEKLEFKKAGLGVLIEQAIDRKSYVLEDSSSILRHSLELTLQQKTKDIEQAAAVLNSVHPKNVLKRGYAIVQSGGRLVSSSRKITSGDRLQLTFKDGKVNVEVDNDK